MDNAPRVNSRESYLCNDSVIGDYEEKTITLGQATEKYFEMTLFRHV